ncbi:ATP-binding protein [Nocardioides litoris]|uniref:ATP-binding protein n=1 Tax=Nocardioides litoris TaxID=1926648 RepID=UPI001122FCD0|nr:ATP-binding protein [Nocardioides litoris]
MARVVVLAGPSGSGKSRLAERLDLPVLRLDDFYKDGADPTNPRITAGPNRGIVDWDDPASWLREEAVAAMVAICRDGGGDVPVYELARDGRTGWQHLDLGGAPLLVAEGIFAQEVVRPLEAEGLLAAAFCVRRRPVVTFWLRLVRDLRERRKPPLVLVRRGLALMRAQRSVVAHAEQLGCRPVTPTEAAADIDRLRRASRADR